MATIQRYTYTYDKFSGSFEAEKVDKIAGKFFEMHAYIILSKHTPVAFARALTYSPDDLLFLIHSVKIRKAIR